MERHLGIHNVVTDTINEIQKTLLEAFVLLRAVVYLL
jgi:hypothetical protein